MSGPRAVFAILFMMAAVSSACPPASRQPDRPSPGDERASTEEAEDAPRSSGGTASAARRVFEPQVAAPGGRGFYTDDSTELRRQLRGFLDAAEPSAELQGRDLVGLVSPHAGYRYSGPTAAWAYRQLEGHEYSTVVVMALSHRRRAAKVALLDHDAYRTPLGDVAIDGEAVAALVAAAPELVAVDPQPFRGEHSLEVQLPFLQLMLGEDFRLVPIVIATGDDAHPARLARLLREQLGDRRDVLFVASSDLSHFYPAAEAERLDRGILDLITRLDIAAFRDRGPRAREMPCGYYPVLTLMELFNGYEPAARRTTLLRYQNSGDTAGDPTRVVGYGAVAFSLTAGTRTRMAPAPAPAPASAGPPSFDESERRALMDLARASVAAAVHAEPFRPERPASPRLRAPGAAFVTLRCETDGSGRCVARGAGLRGCIGHIVARIPLYQCVSQVARSAAIEDRRFPPLSEEELQYVSYEISVLTPPEALADPEDVVVGRDGLIMSRDRNRGLLLPQVPVEWGWDRETFLARTCRKAHMEATCWRDPRTRIERFGAIVWGEDLVATDRHDR